MICVPDHPTSGKFQTFKLHAKLPAISFDPPPQKKRNRFSSWEKVRDASIKQICHLLGLPLDWTVTKYTY